MFGSQDTVQELARALVVEGRSPDPLEAPVDAEHGRVSHLDVEIGAVALYQGREPGPQAICTPSGLNGNSLTLPFK